MVYYAAVYFSTPKRLMKRRGFLLTGAALATLAKADEVTNESPKPAAPPPKQHRFADVIALAKKRSESPDEPKKQTLTGPYTNLSYDQYRGIRFKPEADLFAASGSDFAMDLLPPGRLFDDIVLINLVENGKVVPQPFRHDVFEFDPVLFAPARTLIDDIDASKLSWSGFRLRYPINSPDTQDEFAVFQGASYFRAIARNTLYGLSARGLAISTGNPDGEEFPRFSEFWVHLPKAGDRSVRVDALLESASITGAYQIEITPGAETVFVIKASLFPRTEIREIGIGALTSMYYFSPSRRANINDYRNAVHDSDGLAMLTGNDARLWRALANPMRLQFSAFSDTDPKGFGLLQRNREFSAYQDAEARYDKRPSAWITPRGRWGKGVVSLIEIPVNSEFNDNIIAFWRPIEPLTPNQRNDIAYDLIWSASGPEFTRRAKIIATRSGQTVNNKETYTFTIDFAPLINTQPLDPERLSLALFASKGEILSDHMVILPESGNLRASFDYRPESGSLAELQLRLNVRDESNQNGALAQIAETWMYQWLPS